MAESDLTCKKCATLQPPSAFDKGNFVCRVCRSEISRLRYHSKKGTVLKRNCPTIGGKKQCSTCLKFKELSVDYFEKSERAPYEFKTKCRDCCMSPLVPKKKKSHSWAGKLYGA